MREEKIVSSYLVAPVLFKAPSAWKAGVPWRTWTAKPLVHPLIIHRVQIHFILYRPRLTFHPPNWMIAFGHNIKWNFVVYRYLKQLLWRGLTMKYRVTSAPKKYKVDPWSMFWNIFGEGFKIKIQKKSIESWNNFKKGKVSPFLPIHSILVLIIWMDTNQGRDNYRSITTEWVVLYAHSDAGHFFKKRRVCIQVEINKHEVIPQEYETADN